MELIKIDSFKEKEIITIAEQVKQDILDGNSKGLPAYVQAKALEQLSKEIIKRIKDIAIDEADGYSKNDSVFNGAAFSLSKTPLTLDFEADAEYKELNEKLKARKSKLTDAYKQSQKGSIMIDNDTGEEIPVLNPKKEQETIIKVSFK